MEDNNHTEKTPALEESNDAIKMSDSSTNPYNNNGFCTSSILYLIEDEYCNEDIAVPDEYSEKGSKNAISRASKINRVGFREHLFQVSHEAMAYIDTKENKVTFRKRYEIARLLNESTSEAIDFIATTIHIEEQDISLLGYYIDEMGFLLKQRRKLLEIEFKFHSLGIFSAKNRLYKWQYNYIKKIYKKCQFKLNSIKAFKNHIERNS